MPDAKVRSVQRRSGEVEVAFADADGGERTERFERLLARDRPTPQRRPARPGEHRPRARRQGRAAVRPLHQPVRRQPRLHRRRRRPTTCRCCTRRRTRARSPATTPARFPDVRAQPAPRAARRSCSPSRRSRSSAESWRELQAADVDHAIGEVSFEDQGRSRVMQRNRGLLRVYGAHGTRPVPRRRDDRPARPSTSAICSPGRRSSGLTRARDAAMPFYHPVIEEGLRTALRDLNRAAAHGARAGAPLPGLRPRRLTSSLLLSRSRRGPRITPDARGRCAPAPEPRSRHRPIGPRCLSPPISLSAIRPGGGAVVHRAERPIRGGPLAQTRAASEPGVRNERAALPQTRALGRWADRLKPASWSIIGWVIRQTPLSVRRKRWASSSGSSPTTRPGRDLDAAVDHHLAAAGRRGRSARRAAPRRGRASL